MTHDGRFVVPSGLLPRERATAGPHEAARADLKNWLRKHGHERRWRESRSPVVKRLLLELLEERCR